MRRKIYRRKISFIGILIMLIGVITLFALAMRYSVSNPAT